MFKFIYANSAMVDEVIYILCGIVCIMTGIRGLKNKKAPIGTKSLMAKRLATRYSSQPLQ